MSTGQRLKWSLISVVCIGMCLGLLIAYLRIFGGHVLQIASNPESSVTAEVIEDGSGAGAMDVGYLGVSLKTKFNPIRHYVFGGSNYGAQLHVSWISDDVLLIRCEHCEKLNGGDILERKWDRLTICYDLSNVISQDDASCHRETAETISRP
jgi:hypothetical protein